MRKIKIQTNSQFSSEVTKKDSPLGLSFLGRKIFLLFAVAVFTVASIAVAFSPLVPSASAAGTETLQDRALSQVYLNALMKCVKDKKINDNNAWDVNILYSPGAAAAGDWFMKDDPAFLGQTQGKQWARPGYIVEGVKADTGEILCNDIVKKGAAHWGYSSPMELLCSFVDERANGSSCETGNGDFGGDELTGHQADLKAAVVAKVYGGNAPNFSGTDGKAQLYLIYQAAFFDGCSAQKSANPPSNFKYTVTTVNDDGTLNKDVVYEGLDRSTKRWVYTDGSQNELEKTCAEIAAAVNQYSTDYSDYRYDNTAEPTTPVGEACEADPKPEGCEPTESETSCNVDGVGWIVCPILTFGARLADDSYQFLADNFLAVNTGILGTDPNATTQSEDGTLIKTGNGTFVAWGIIRNLANIAFVIVFLIVIFSQLTGMGVSNYGVKKVLPRLVIGAILVNISFYVCQIAVDLSNIAGYGLKSLLEGVANQVTAASGGTAVNAGDESGHLFGIITIILTAGVLVYFNLAAVILAIIGGLVVLLTIFVLLTARQALIVLLIVIAPLAFVAFLLPNTEQFFKRWQKMFTALLLLFPIIGLLYGACLIASAVLMQVAGDNVVMQIAAYLALVLPLIAVIPLLKGALSAVPVIGAAIQKAGSKTSGLAQGGAKRGAAAYKNSGFGKFRTGKAAERKARIAAGTYVGAGGNFNPRNIRSQANQKLNTSDAFNKVTGGFGAQRDLTAQAQNRSDQKEAIDMFSGDDALVQAWVQSGGSKSHPEYIKLAKNSPASAAQFDKMVEAGHAKRAASFLGAAQYLSESGKGVTGSIDPVTGEKKPSDIRAALERARQAGADSTVTSGAAQAAIAAYRKSGRGDALAELSTEENAKHPDPAERKVVTAQKAWSEVSPSAVHREAIKPGTQSRAEYETFLQSDPENARKALAGYDSMEARAQASAQAAIVAAAQLHQYNATGATPTISNVQDAKVYFNVK